MDEIANHKNRNYMKPGICVLLILLLTIQTIAQRPQRCEIPIPDFVFRQKQKSVKIQPTEHLKLQVAVEIAINNCLSVEQIKGISILFTDDYKRLEFAKTAWHNTVDKENFYFVYDDFAYFSTVFMLHDYVKTMDHHPTDYIPPYEPTISLNFPDLNYPAFENYQGPTGCNYPVGEDEFFKLARQVSANNQENNRLLLLTQIIQNNCISVSQAMKFASMLSSEPDRLQFFKTAYFSIFDLNNLSSGVQLFAHIPNKAAYNEFINNPKPGPGSELPPPCKIEPDEFIMLKESIQKESFNNTRLTIAKQIIRSKECFTTRQITDLVRLFSFEDSRLELAEFAWDFTIDKENYFQIADALSFSSSKEELMKFMEKKNK
jgi:hypothetical protein